MNSAADQLLLDRLGINFLDQRSDLILIGLHDQVQHFGWIFVTGLHAFKVDDAKAAETVHLDAKAHIGDAVHGTGNDRNFESNVAAIFSWYLKACIHFGRIDGDLSRHERDFVEPVGDAGFSIAANPHSHNACS